MKHTNRISQYFDQDESPTFSDKRIVNNDALPEMEERSEQDSKRIKNCESFNCGPNMEVEG